MLTEQCDASDRARGHLILGQEKPPGRRLEGGASAEACSVSHGQISDVRQTLAAFLGIFCSFLAILASAAAGQGKPGPSGQSRAVLFPGELKQGGQPRMAVGDGRRPASIPRLTTSQLASLRFLLSDHQRNRGAGQFCELLDCAIGPGIDQAQESDLNREIFAL